MATIIMVGTPRNDSERMAIGYLRDHLPVNYTVIHNFELTQGNETFEIDLLILAPHCIYLVDVKGVHGIVDIQGGRWYPQGRAPYTSPLARARQHAKLLKALLVDTYRAYPQMERMYVRAAVLLTASNVQISDSTGNDINDCVRLNKCVPYFQSKANVPAGLSTDIISLLPMIQKTIVGKARASQKRTYREWSVEENLGGNDRYTEYRARHLYGKHGTARLRVYRADPYQDEAIRKREQKIISNAYRAVGNMPGHPNILNVRDFFPADDDSYFVLVTDDAEGQTLRQHIKKASLALTFDQKVRVMRDVLNALEHAHSYQVVHRNLTPDTIFVGNDGHARLYSFEYARLTASETSSIGTDIAEAVDQHYQSPEFFGDSSKVTATSDLFSAGLVFYELLTGENAFNSIDHIYETGAIFPVKPTVLKPDLPPGLDDWLQKLCAFQPADRYLDAATALAELNRILMPAQGGQVAGGVPTETAAKRISSAPAPIDKQNLPREYILGDRFMVQERLGQGGFAVAYLVLDMMSEVKRVLKLVLKDAISIMQRLRQEYKTLSAIPEHPYVVKVIWADRLADGTPYIVFEYVDGLNVEELVRDKALTLEDAIKLTMQVAEGLAFLHEHGVFHQDIKPSNLLWTDTGVRIIDFNVAVSEQATTNMPGGTGRYIPPDLYNVADLSTAQKIERDVYALGVTLYECVTGHYPFEDANIRKVPTDPYVYEPDLHPDVAALLLKAISPDASERFRSATALQNALKALVTLRKPVVPSVSAPLEEAIERPNYNPYVSHLLTLYSQSQRTNAGTRGLDSFGEQTYVETLLDMQLRPAILRGDFQLVIISGNAGDGKTAFIQRLAKDAERLGAELHHQVNGYTFTLQGRTFVSNYDGSQDEGETTNDDVLLAFFAPFKGSDETAWTQHETRLIAINEGRLIDFLTEHEWDFPRLIAYVRDGLNGLARQETQGNVAIVNLNLRAVVADTPDATGREQERSIFDHQLRRMTEKQFWNACEQCDLKQQCYIYHNARTFMDPVAGTRTIERLKTLYTMTHLRGQLHITIRDLRSALAYMLVGTRDCDDVHTLYTEGTSEAAQQILDGYYFNAWMGGSTPSTDRLITLLRQIDMGEVSNPELDRTFDFLQPGSRDMGRFTYTGRSNYDDELLTKSFQMLPRDFTEKTRTRNIERHRAYVAMLRRRHYFECRSESWEEMLPYHHYKPFFKLVTHALDGDSAMRQVYSLLEAINRGEGLIDATRLSNVLALRVRQVERGTIQSYRLFSGQLFKLTRRETQESTRFIEHLPQSLYLSYASDTGHKAELRINLDIYEMLMRLNDGYRPSQEELQGFYLSLIVFKNVLSSAPYQEVLLTETGHEFYRISRSSDGILTLNQLTQP